MEFDARYEDEYSKLPPRPPVKPETLDPINRDKENQSRILHSFLKNFLSDDLGTFKQHIDLPRHALDSGAPITDATVQEVADLHPDVVSLNLRKCDQVTDVGLWALARGCVKLEQIQLSDCIKITQIGLRSLSLRCSKLKFVDLTRCTKVNDAALKVLAAGCWGIEVLRVEDCMLVGDSGIVEIARCCKSMIELNLAGCVHLCEFGDKALAEIGTHCNDLERLNLRGCPFY